MSEIWLPYGADGTPLTVVQEGVTYRVLRVDSDGHLQVDALSSALPSGAATAARQDTMITALQLIDDLRNALAAVATDQLRTDVISSALPTGAATQTTLAVIKDKILALLWGYTDEYGEALDVASATAGTNTMLGGVVPAGEIWIVNNLAVKDANSATTEIRLGFAMSGGTQYGHCKASPAAGEWVTWQGWQPLKAGNRVSCAVFGATAGDFLFCRVSGHKMAVA